MKAAIVVGVLAMPAVAGADEIFLRSGGHLTGLIVERRAEGIVIDVGPGRVTLPARLVERIVEGTPAFETFRERSARLAATDVKGWLELAQWARDHDLLTQSRQAFEHVVSIDPGNPFARRELGHVMVDGRWMTAEEAYRARGYVNFEGNWVTPDERMALLSERAAEAQARQAEMEAAARAREAEARARTAEAEARRAEADAATATAATEGIPLGLAYGGVPYGGYGPVVIGGYGFGFGHGFRSGRHDWMHGRGSGHRKGPSCGPTNPPTAPAPPSSNRGTTARSDHSLPSTPPPAAPARGAVGGLRLGPKAAQPAY